MSLLYCTVIFVLHKFRFDITVSRPETHSKLFFYSDRGVLQNSLRALVKPSRTRYGNIPLYMDMSSFRSSNFAALLWLSSSRSIERMSMTLLSTKLVILTNSIFKQVMMEFVKSTQIQWSIILCWLFVNLAKSVKEYEQTQSKICLLSRANICDCLRMYCSNECVKWYVQEFSMSN